MYVLLYFALLLLTPSLALADLSKAHYFLDSSSIKVDTMVSFNNSEKVFIGHINAGGFGIKGYMCGNVSSSSKFEKQTLLKKTLLPAMMFKSYNLKLVLLCDSISFRKQQIGGVSFPSEQLMLLDSSVDLEKFTHLFWHELWHFIEFSSFPYLASIWRDKFQGYEMSYAAAKSSIEIGSAGVGYINEYAYSFPYEERAEIFSWLKTRPSQLQSYLKNHNDSILKAKIKLIEKKLESLEFDDDRTRF